MLFANLLLPYVEKEKSTRVSFQCSQPHTYSMAVCGVHVPLLELHSPLNEEKQQHIILNAQHIRRRRGDGFELSSPLNI